MPATVAPGVGSMMETLGGVVSGVVLTSSCEGILTMNASRRPPPAFEVKMKYCPVTSRLPLGPFE